MRQIVNFLALFLVIGAFGCGTTPYKVTATTAVTVQAAMREWNVWVGQKQATVAQEQAVKSAYEKWQSAMAVVCDAGKVYQAAANSGAANTSVLLAALEQAVANATASQNDVIDLVTKFGVKL